LVEASSHQCWRWKLGPYPAPHGSWRRRRYQRDLSNGAKRTANMFGTRAKHHATLMRPCSTERPRPRPLHRTLHTLTDLDTCSARHHIAAWGQRGNGGAKCIPLVGRWKLPARINLLYQSTSTLPCPLAPTVTCRYQHRLKCQSTKVYSTTQNRLSRAGAPFAYSLSNPELFSTPSGSRICQSASIDYDMIPVPRDTPC
jgi:hypothetical protein